jgi:hypothetical protein
MTETVTPMAAQITSGPPAFATLREIYARPTATAVTLSFLTDQAVQCSVDWYPIDENIANSGTVTDAAATTSHTLTFTPGAGHNGKDYGFRIYLAATDVSGLTLRPYNGTIQLLGARAAGQTAFGSALSVPVRWNMFGGTPPAPAGGGGIGNWNQYAWAQYNPKGTTYPTP